ncbi:protein PHLOEM PROTEIN 2-LIKE A9-like [Cucurbita pepo subsp. pepo]|uniref:protein PHLOEM PROTEIN 2-LIKE A9-like n=1 Tax=Cucurbita pepo subsp. pepo TaxID=3664 RepID=UPI000C9D9B60|nr:protein PHLOEM PROTEIN 2-LIKE A9-like [Cucurbita pepo subsp. pepo]
MMQTGPHHAAEEDALREENNKLIIYPRGFNITWGNDDRYWRIVNSDESENSRVAELKQVSWLEVTCSTDKVEFGKRYKVGFNVLLRPDAFGWKGLDVYVMAKVGKAGKFFPKKVSLGDDHPKQKFIIPKTPLVISIDRSTAKEKSIHLGLYEVWSSKWKGGLEIHNAFIEKVD